MIYSVNYIDMADKLNPLAVGKYLEQTNWSKFQFGRKNVSVYQKEKNEELMQVMLPLDRELSDYKQSMYDVVKTIAEVEDKSVEQVMLFLLNPNTDIIKIRLDNKAVESGNILFDDAIRVYENAKKLIAATALDIINPKKIHYGRTDDSVQKFLNRCRFGQTEIGSYVVSVVCPFAELSDENEIKQLTIFSDEECCENSLTRKVTSKLIDNIAFIKNKIDSGELDSLVTEDNGISSNFYEALNGLNSEDGSTIVDFIPEWSPKVKSNRSTYSSVRLSGDYYQPISTVVDRIKGSMSRQTEVVGKISRLMAAPSIDVRSSGTIAIVFVNDKNKAQTVTVELRKEDYCSAVEAHQHGKVVKVMGELIGGTKLKMENAVFSVIE